MSTDPIFVETPPKLGRYELLVPVARGGMGQVWLGRLRGARGFNKLVAVKTLLPLPDTDGRLESMLLEEARLAALVHHANVVQTLELGEDEGTLYLVMEWIDGESLAHVIYEAEQRGGIPLPIAVNFVGQTLLGLHAAHELTDEAGTSLGVVHRDVSPHNVLVTYDGVAKLVDFGIAKATNQSMTHSGEIKGKISYMAPEQIRCEAVDRRADIFSVGVMLYLLTTRQHPFRGSNTAGMLHRMISDEPAPSPASLVADYPSELERVVLKAIELEADRRFSSAAEMLEALRRAVPNAFEPGFDAQVKSYVRQLLEQRATKRREGLRRAQLAADSRARATETSNPAQSASSLRALSVDNPAESVAPAAPARTSANPEPPRKRRVTPYALGAGILCLLALTLAIGVKRGDSSATAASHGPLVELTPALARDTPRPTGPAKPAVASRSPEENGRASQSGRGVDTPGAAVTASTARPKPRREREKRRPAAQASDLLVPDYAR